MEKVRQGRGITRATDRGECSFDPWDRTQFPKPRPLTPGQIALGEWLRAATRHVDQTEIDRFFEEIDAFTDPSPRVWSDSDW